MPFKGIQKLIVARSHLSIRFDEGTLLLDLGAAAEKWMRKIQNLPSLIDKVGVKAGAVVSVIAIRDEAFVTALKAVILDWKTLHKKRSDFFFLGIESQNDLKQIVKAEAQLTPAGALWVVWPKGQKQITESHGMAVGRAAGLVDTKAASFSATHTALKMVILALRRASAGPA